MSDVHADLDLIEMAAEIVSAYVRNNSVPAHDLPNLLHSIHGALSGIVSGPKVEPVKEAPQPKVSVKRSVTDEFIVCLEDGRRFKSLKRHLHAEHGLSPQEYRAKWGLAKDYPMVAPAYASARSNLAKSLGLGRKAVVKAPEPESDPAPVKKPRRRAAAA